MKIITTPHLTELQQQAICHLWNDEYPQALSHKDLESFQNYLIQLEDAKHLLLLDETEQIKGWAFLFTRDNEVWFAIILASNLHKMGFGSKLLDELKTLNPQLNGWVIESTTMLKSNGKYYRSPIQFYVKNNFQILHQNKLELPHFSAVKIVWNK